MLKDSAFSEHEEGPALREVPLAQEMAVSLGIGGFGLDSECTQCVRKQRIPTIYLIHVIKSWKVAGSFSKKHQIGGVKKPRSLRLQSLLGFE